MMIDNELDFNESQIGQREEEIRGIEHGISEINEIFRDLGTMVYEQNSLLGNVNWSIISCSSTRTHRAKVIRC